jgi:hypothetical protein
MTRLKAVGEVIIVLISGDGLEKRIKSQSDRVAPTYETHCLVWPRIGPRYSAKSTVPSLSDTTQVAIKRAYLYTETRWRYGVVEHVYRERIEER